MTKPLIALVADCRESDGQTFHTVGDKYLRAIALGAGGVPIVLPALAALHTPEDLRALVAGLDGVCLTGSPSNVHPSHYGEPARGQTGPHDVERDATTLALIPELLRQGVPLLAICRGFQELNVALGGTLHAQVHQVPGLMDHRAPRTDDRALRYGPRHPVRLAPGGELARLAGAGTLMVNSLHGQGVARLAEGLVVEATASDGLVEAARVRGAARFTLGVQWHPEYRALDDPFSTRLFAAFGEAAGARRRERTAGALHP